jgi:Protein of unknown function (DUF4236)
MGSFRFRRTIKIAPGVRLNINKRSVGVSAGARGARVSVNSDGRSTRSVGVPGTGLYYRSQPMLTSPTRIIAHIIGVLTVAAFIFGILEDHPPFAGTVCAIGIVLYIALRVLRGVLDPLILWLLTRHDTPAE